MIKATNVSALTPHNKALYEAGKSLLVSSVEVGRDFCKFMVGTASGAVAVYIAVLTFALPKDYAPSLLQGFLFVIPSGFFLAATMVFARGYFPIEGTFSLDVLSEIENERKNNIAHRLKFARAGFILFSLGVSSAIVICLWAQTIKLPPATPTPS